MKVDHLQRAWYVVYSKPHREEQAQFHLGLKNIESFFPRLHLPGTTDKKTNRCVVSELFLRSNSFGH